MDRQAYREMVEMAPASTRVVEFRDGDGALVGVSLTDRLRSGLSGVYKFFAPEAAAALARHLHHPLAHRAGARLWACLTSISATGSRESRKMAYKARFAPLEQLDGPEWRPLPVAAIDAGGRSDAARSGSRFPASLGGDHRAQSRFLSTADRAVDRDSGDGA